MGLRSLESLDFIAEYIGMSLLQIVYQSGSIRNNQCGILLLVLCCSAWLQSSCSRDTYQTEQKRGGEEVQVEREFFFPPLEALLKAVRATGILDQPGELAA
nr:uncharacterized protein LOC127294164 [Lolium perenne]